MSTSYRIICCENEEKYPGKTFVDIMPAMQVRQEDCLSHRFMEKLRQQQNPGVHCVEYGFILTEKNNGDLEISYEESYHQDISRYYQLFQAKYEDKMFKAFREMREAGRDRTFHINMTDLAKLYGCGAEMVNNNGPVKSSYEERFFEAAERAQRREENMAMQREYDRKNDVGSLEYLRRKYLYRGYDGD